MTRPNILFIANYWRDANAASISTLYLLKALSLLGVKTLLITHDVEGSTTWDTQATEYVNHLKIIRLNSRLLTNKVFRYTIGYVWIFLRGLRECIVNGISIIVTQHHNFHLASLTGALLSLILKTPLIVHVRDCIPYIGRNTIERIINIGIFSALNRAAFKRAKFVLVPSSELRFLIHRIFRIPLRKILIIPNIIDPSIFNKYSYLESRKKLGISKEVIVLLFIGNIYNRGLDLVIHSLPYLIKVIPSIKLIIAGTNFDKIVYLIRKLQLIDHVLYLGNVPYNTIPTLISASDITIGPIRASMETIGAIPRKVVEYMACGKPVIVGQNTISKDLIVDNTTGFIVKPNKESLLRILLYLINDPSIRVRIGESARQHVVKYFSVNAVIQKLRYIIRSISPRCYLLT